MRKRPTKKQLIIILVAVILLIIGFNIAAQWYQAQQEVKNVQATRQDVGRVMSELEGKWQDESSCYIALAGEIGTIDHYYCETKYVNEYSPRDEKGLVAVMDADDKKLRSAPEVTRLSARASQWGELRSKFVYDVDFKVTQVGDTNTGCMLQYFHQKPTSEMNGEMICHREISHSAYDALVKAGYPITSARQ